MTRPLTEEELRDKGFHSAADAKARSRMLDFYLGEERWMPSPFNHPKGIRQR